MIVTDIPKDVLDLCRMLAYACTKLESDTNSLSLNDIVHRQSLEQRIRKIAGQPFDMGKVETAINYLLSH